MSGKKLCFLAYFLLKMEMWLLLFKFYIAYFLIFSFNAYSSDIMQCIRFCFISPAALELQHALIEALKILQQAWTIYEHQSAFIPSKNFKPFCDENHLELDFFRYCSYFRRK